MRRSGTVPSCLFVLLVICQTAPAQIKTDGSLGARQTLSGPAFTIPATVGRQVGGNLFHSFSDFNVQTGQSATFTGPTTVQNVLARVTGGAPSAIDGALRCDISGANLYLMNPAGVVFGPNATLDVTGSFAVTSADYLRLGKTGRFSAMPAAHEVLTSAAPTAFGFLAPRPGASVGLVGSQISVNTGKTLSIVSNGDVALVSAALRAPAGRVNLIAAGSKGQVGLRAGDLDSPVDSSLTTYADVAATMGATIDTSGDFGGPVTVLARNLSLETSGLASATLGATAGRAIDLRLSGDLTLTGGSLVNISTLGGATGSNLDVRAGGAFAMSGSSQIIGTTFGAAGGGHISVAADSITMNGPATVILNGPAPAATGNGGDILLRAHSLSLAGQSAVAVGTLGSGDGGTLRVRADDVLIRGDGTLRATGLFASSDPGTSGRSGSISIRAGAIRLERAGVISVETSGSGAAGEIDVTAMSVAMRDSGTLLLADTAAATGGGIGGNISMNVGTLVVARGAVILAGTFGDGRGGNVAIEAGSLGLSSGGQIIGGTVGAGAGGMVSISAGSLTLSGTDSVIRSGAEATATGSSGDITVHAGRLTIADGAGIGAGTLGAGAGGNIAVRADNLLIRGNGTPKKTGLFASTAVDTTGAGGNIVVDAGQIRIDRAGIITVETAGSGRGGSIRINADSMTVDGLGTLIQADTAAATGGGPGGSMRLDVPALTLSQGALLVGATFGDGHGGSILINSDSVIIRDPGSSIFAPTTALTGGGDAGTLTLNARSLTIRDGANIVVGTLGSGAGGQATINVNTVRMHGLSSETVDDSSTLIAVGSIAGSGRGGDLEMRADSLRVENSAVIAVGTTGAGQGGSARIEARRIALDRGAILAGSEAADPTDPPATGDAGSVAVHASKSLSLRNGSNIGAKAIVSNGGTIELRAPRLTLTDSMISGQAGQTGGSINIVAHDLLYLFRSQINAVGEQQLGNITIDPQFTVLDHSSITTTTQANAGGNISLRTNRLFESLDSVVTAAQGATITLTVYTPDTNITGSLVPIRASLIDASAKFAEECSRRLEMDLSSFLITGRGATPAEPGGLSPAFQLSPLVRPATSPSR